MYTDVARIRRNVQKICDRISPAKVVLCIKADAYNHSAYAVAANVQADYYAVANAAEGIALRRAGIKSRIIALSVGAGEIAAAVKSGLDISVDTCALAYRAARLQEDINEKIRVHVAVNTGMNRYGLTDSEEIHRCFTLLQSAGIEAVSVFSHIYGKEYYEAQTLRYDAAANIARSYYENIETHIASSSTYDKNKYGMVRIGLAAYTDGDGGALSATAEIRAVRRVKMGETVGYGGVFKTVRDTNIAVIGAGYADGIDERRDKYVLIRGQRCEVVAVCMDCFMADAHTLAPDVGEHAELISDDITLTEKAEGNDAMKYRILTAYHGRVTRSVML